MAEGKHKGGISSFSVILLTVVASIVGLALMRSLHVQYAPSPLKRSITVSFHWPDASPSNVEAKATSILESALSGVKYCSGISSTSDKGLASIEVDFPKKTNMSAARFEVASCIRNVYPSLPDGVTYPSISLGVSGRGSKTVLTYVFKSDLPSKEIEKYVSSHVLPQISVIEGVDKVSLNGATPFEWVIRFDNDAASSLGVSSSDIASAFANWTGYSSVGTTDIGNGTMAVKIKAASSGDFGNIPVKKVGDRIVYLRDIATWRYKESLPQSYYRLNGLNTITLSMGVASGVNMLSVGKAVRAKMTELQRSFPSSITMTLSSDSTEYIVKELDKIYFRTFLCILLLLLFVLVINRSWRYMLLIAITLTVNMLVSVAFYALAGIPIHIYTLAGITVSLGIIIDTSIVMIDHYGYYRNRKVFLAIFGAVATTVAALLVVLLLPESERANLVDFIWVIVINLVVSLAVAYFFVPALLDYMPLRRSVGTSSASKTSFAEPSVSSALRPTIADGTRPVRSRRRIVRWSHRYEKYIAFGMRHRWAYIVLLIIAFGIPLCLLPDKIEPSSSKPLTKADSLYNRVVGWRPYSDNKTAIDKVVGTSFALFNKAVNGSNFYREPTRKELDIVASMPEGCTVAQLNEVMRSMENFLSQYDEIESFTTSINSYDDGYIAVNFKPEYEKTSFPDQLKSLVTASAINFGGANWSIYGVNESYFNNNIVSSYKGNRISMSGYNYETLIKYAQQLIDTLSANRRVEGPEIWSGEWGGAPATELEMGYDFQKMSVSDVNPYHYYSTLSSMLYDNAIGSVMTDGEMTPVLLESSSIDKFDMWNVLNSGVKLDSSYVKLADVGSIVKNRLELPIHKENQSYQVSVCYDFIGSYELGKKVSDDAISAISRVLPVGYRAYSPDYSWSEEHKGAYAWLILLVIAVIFVICAMIFDSLRQPFSIIGIIPVSFIGIFLAFGLFDFPFDQGGFASFVMVAGLVVNAGIYMIVAFRAENKATAEASVPSEDLNSAWSSVPSASSNPVIVSTPSAGSRQIRNYVKAFNHKIVPTTLTIISTILGLVPFLFDGPSEVFWFAFAIGTISGLIFSVISVIFYLPVFLLKRK
jgi:multidrug efflux pump subunit AcrB